MLSYVKKFVRGEEGATMVEYGLMLALIAVVCIGAVTLDRDECERDVHWTIGHRAAAQKAPAVSRFHARAPGPMERARSCGKALWVGSWLGSVPPRC